MGNSRSSLEAQKNFEILDTLPLKPEYALHQQCADFPINVCPCNIHLSDAISEWSRSMCIVEWDCSIVRSKPFEEEAQVMHIEQRSTISLLHRLTNKRVLRFVPLAVGCPSLDERYG